MLVPTHGTTKNFRPDIDYTKYRNTCPNEYILKGSHTATKPWATKIRYNRRTPIAVECSLPTNILVITCASSNSHIYDAVDQTHTLKPQQFLTVKVRHQQNITENNELVTGTRILISVP